ncbi:MAG: hypothetical protein CL899_03050 [Dehalococcoidia bacterium]|nr:hypothetical protein [Dehalococcoidia bacterium]|tara:strand:+ start:254 stop:781 length:528 start_codon:yes stop_codon:yes gene_type:complete
MNNYFIIIFIGIISVSIIACGESQNDAKASLETIIEPQFFVEMNDINSTKIKFGKKYDVSELPKAIAVSRAIYMKKDIEIRAYQSHVDAVQYGEDYAASVTGKDALVSGDEIMWKEGAKDRRKCVPRAGNSEAGCDQKPRFGGYVIVGNLVILCEGLSKQESLTLCHSFKNSIVP